MDIIFLQNLHVDAIIGINDDERVRKQPVVVDLEMGTDIAAAAASEDIANTINYFDVSERLAAFIAETEFLLIETLIEAIARVVQDEFGVRWVKVTLHKPDALKGAQNVGIVIERGQRF